MQSIGPLQAEDPPPEVPDDHPSDFIIDDVRVTPPHMHFENAYEGKQYKETMTIQNCGTRLAFVRLSKANSTMFKFKSFNRGIYLAPGMKITRTVTYMYRKAMGTLQGYATMWVNNEQKDYYFNVSLTMAVLSVEPRQLDFGKSDAVSHAITRTFHIINSGYKGAHFSIDLGANPLDLHVDPLKGIIPAMSSVPVTVDIIGSCEGEFLEEIWIKTTPPLRIVISGAFIAPKLLVRKFVNSLDFTLIEFPPTYYGSTSAQSLLIKNFSSSHCMFCVMAEIKGTTMTLDDARKMDDNFKNFVVAPIDGRLAAQRGSLIQIIFKPIKSLVKNKVYAACFLKVIRMDCRDINDQDTFIDRANECSLQNLSEMSVCTSLNKQFSKTAALSLISLVHEEVPLADDNFSFEHAVGICVHGEKECVNVCLRPTSIELNQLTLNQTYQREVLIENKSSRLPIRVKYKKIACIDVVPNLIDLRPKEIIEVLLTVRTFKLDRVEKKVTFDLLAKDHPAAGTVFRKVGYVSLPLSFETAVVARKPKVITCMTCTDLAEKLEPEFPYRLTDTELAKKNQNEEYYLKYIRSLQKKPVKIYEEQLEYVLTKKKLLKCGKISPRGDQEKSYSPFIPLAPRLLYNVKVIPKSVKLQKVAANTMITDFLTIKNSNTFPIHAFVMSSKPEIVFDFRRHLIEAGENKKIYFSFSNNRVGRYYINVNVLINDFALYEVTALARVVPKTLKLDSTTIQFSENDDKYKFFKLRNALNAFTSFEWDLSEGCFSIYPKDGGIKAESFILCMVTYHPEALKQTAADATLTSESGQRRILTMSCKKQKHSVVFDCYDIDLGVIPLNVPIMRKLTLKNLKNLEVSYTIVNSIPIPGVTINPKEGILDGLDSQVFIIQIRIQAVIQFSSDIVFLINDEEEISISLQGIVEFPKVSLKPSTLYFRKISPHSFDTLAFKVTNQSICECKVDFPMEDFPEFTITPYENVMYPHTKRITLYSKQSKVLYLHFLPNQISTYLFYMPYVINEILGPPHINSNATYTPQHFLQKATHFYDRVKKATIETLPRTLPVIRINSIATEKALEFSNLNMNFLYFGEGHYNNVTSCDFEIFNVKTDVAEICIRVDDLDYPFSLIAKEENNIEYHEVSFKITLQPGEKVSFVAEFFPVDFGKYTLQLPIFLRGYYDNKVFNYLILNGVYGRPTIIPSSKRCDFEPIPTRLTNEISFTVRLYNHFENCDLFVESDLNGLYTSFEKDKASTREKIILNMTLCFDFRFSTSFGSEVTFQCTCGASSSIMVTGVTENCLLTTHAFSHMLKREAKIKSKSLVVCTGDWYEDPKFVDLLVHKNVTCFPLFPKQDDSSNYAKYMRSLQKTLENWLFSQAFYKKCYYRIPEGFSDFCKVFEPPRKMIFGGYKDPKLGDLPLLRLMMNIAGSHIRKQLAPSFPKRNEEKEWLIYTHKTNTNILNYLQNYSVYLPHVEAKFLLNYQQYLNFQKYKHPKEKPFDEVTFYRLSKQCWIDMILQIIKVFYLFRTVHLPVREELTPQPSQNKFRFRQSFSVASRSSVDEENETIFDIGVYGKHERELISWLQDCFNKERDHLWDTPLEPRDVIFLDEDLKDGLVLGAAIAHYCPYIKSEIETLYTEPNNPEELLHNAFTIIKTWKMLNFSYVITPLEFQNCGMVEMLLIVNYLYDMLPNCCPKEEVTVEALLTQSNSTIIELENEGSDPIYYKAIFFNNEADLFTINTKSITVEPRNRKKVKVRYHAKFVSNVNATLLFSGETPGSKYGKSIAIKLKGVADVSYACMHIPLTVDLYKPCNVSLQPRSPFRVKAKYTLFFGYQPVVKDKNLLFPWEEVKNLKIIKECYLQDEICEFDEEGKCSTTELVCCRQQGPRNIWFYFTNPEVGDWGVQITLTGRVTDDCYENIFVDIPANYEDFVCRCRKVPCLYTSCPKILYADIPMKNNLLWNARKAVVLHHVEGEELGFWNKRIYTPIGTRILKLILNSETHPMKQFVEDTVEYKVEMERHPSPFITLKKVVIEDVTSEDYFPLPIHPVKDLLQVKKWALKLVSSDEGETRYYRLLFHRSGDKVTTFT